MPLKRIAVFLPLLLLALAAAAAAAAAATSAEPPPPGSCAAGSGADIDACQVDAAAYNSLARLRALLEDARSGWAAARGRSDGDGGGDGDGSGDSADQQPVVCARLQQLQPGADADALRRLVSGGGSAGAGRLWRLWSGSTVYNWTSEEVSAWADRQVGLPGLAREVLRHRVTGRHLPLFTESARPVHPALRGLGKEQRRMLAIRATDLVLFGPPRRPPTTLQHVLLATLLLTGLGGLWLGCVQMKFFDDSRQKFADQSGHLMQSEKSLADLQEKLASAEDQSSKAREEKQRLEEAYQREIARLKERAQFLSHERRRSSVDADATAQLALAEQEVAHLRALLEQSERLRPPASSVSASASTAAAAAAPSAELLHLLRLCYETELRYCSENRLKAEDQLARASDSLQKLLRKQYTFVGVFRSAFNLPEMINQVEKEIVTAKDFADKVKLNIHERILRWSRVEELLGIDIIPKQEQPMSMRTYVNIRSCAVRWKLKTATESNMRRMALENAAAAASASPAAGAATSTWVADHREEFASQLQNHLPMKRSSVPSIGLGRILADSKQALREAESSELRMRSHPTLQQHHQQLQHHQRSPLTASDDVVFSVPFEPDADPETLAPPALMPNQEALADGAADAETELAAEAEVEAEAVAETRVETGVEIGVEEAVASAAEADAATAEAFAAPLPRPPLPTSQRGSLSRITTGASLPRPPLPTSQRGSLSRITTGASLATARGNGGGGGGGGQNADVPITATAATVGKKRKRMKLLKYFSGGGGSSGGGAKSKDS